MNPYKILGIKETATDKEIKKAWRDLSKKHHPDISKSNDETYHEIQKAYELLKDQLGSAMITSPISKSAWKLADINFTGHTDLLGDLAKMDNYLMMFLSSKFKTALTTIHEPIKRVPSLIISSRIKNVVKEVQNTFEFDLKIKSPRIAILRPWVG